MAYITTDRVTFRFKVLFPTSLYLTTFWITFWSERQTHHRDKNGHSTLPNTPAEACDIFRPRNKQYNGQKIIKSVLQLNIRTYIKMSNMKE